MMLALRNSVKLQGSGMLTKWTPAPLSFMGKVGASYVRHAGKNRAGGQGSAMPCGCSGPVLSFSGSDLCSSSITAHHTGMVGGGGTACLLPVLSVFSPVFAILESQ